MNFNEKWTYDEWLGDEINEYNELSYAINLLRLNAYISEDLHKMLVARNESDHREALNEKNRRDKKSEKR